MPNARGANADLPDPELLTFDDVARLARVPASRVRSWQRRGRLPGIRPVGTNLILFPRDRVMAWLRGEATADGGAP